MAAHLSTLNRDKRQLGTVNINDQLWPDLSKRWAHRLRPIRLVTNKDGQCPFTLQLKDFAWITACLGSGAIPSRKIHSTNSPRLPLVIGFGDFFAGGPLLLLQSFLLLAGQVYGNNNKSKNAINQWEAILFCNTLKKKNTIIHTIIKTNQEKKNRTSVMTKLKMQ